MTRQEFWEWLEECPTHKWEVSIDGINYIPITFPVSEDEEENE